MKVRIITAVVGIAVFLPIVIFSHTWVYPAFMMIACLVAEFELLRAMGLHKRMIFAIPTLLYTVFAFVMLAFLPDFEHGLLLTGAVGIIYLFMMFACAMLAGGEVIHGGEVRSTQAATLVAFTIYILLGFLTMCFVRRLDHGLLMLFAVFFGAWFTDSFAYFTGVLLGKHKMIPTVSPKKTWEGAIGGVVGTIVVFVVYGLIVHLVNPDIKANYVALAVVGFILAVVSQFGDLIASYLKREQGIKDYGRVLPGHGGVLDRFDSVIAVSSFLYFSSILLAEIGGSALFS